MNLLKKQSGFSARGGPALGWALPLVILIVVILIIVGGVGYYAYRSYKAYREIKTPEMVKPKPTIDETANWKVYRNEEYKFKIKYPEDWNTKTKTLMSDLGHLDYFWADGLSIDVWNTSVYSYGHLKQAPPGGIDPDSVREKSIFIDDYPAIEVFYIAVGDAGLGGRAVKKVSILKNQLVYIIECVGERCDQILSTFKFIK